MSKSKQRARIARANGRKAEREQAITTPEVITLPEDIVAEAEAVMEASVIPHGPRSMVPRSESSVLYQAATDPEKAMQDIADYVEKAPAVRTVPLDNVENVDEVDYSDIPAIDDAELAATEIVNNVEHPIDVLFTEYVPASEVNFADSSYILLSEGGQHLLDSLTGAATNAGKFANQVKLRIIAFGNDTKDFAMMLGNKAWAIHDDLKKNPAAPYIWFKEQQEKLTNWATKPSSNDAIRELSQVILDMKDTYEQEMRRMSGRITDLEKALRKNTKAYNRVDQMAGQVEPGQLQAFLAATRQGRKAKAIDLYRAMTGCDLTTAKVAIEASA